MDGFMDSCRHRTRRRAGLGLPKCKIIRSFYQ